jgi:hypothetical protein
MLRSAGLAVSLLLCTSPISAHDAFVLDARRATPGPRLELVELPTAGAAGKRYRLEVGPGLARGTVFGVFTKPFDHGFHEAESGFQVDEAGALVTGKPGEAGRRRLDGIALGPGPYPLAAVWEVALVSADRSVRLFARVVPYPLTASEGGCRVSLELASHLGERFLASGSGFPPGEDVLTEQRYSGRQIQKPRRVSPEGLLTPDLLSHRATGADRGARYAVRARTCQVAIEYNWGEPALMRR